MDESQVAAQVAQNIPKEETPIETPLDAPEPDSGEVSKTPIYINDPVMEMRLLDYFAVGRTEKYSERTQTQLRNIMEWAATESQSTDYGSIVSMVNALERQLGLALKPNRLGLLYRYIVLNREATQIQKEMRTIGGNSLY